MRQFWCPGVLVRRMIATAALLLSVLPPVLALTMPGPSVSSVQPLVTQLIVKFKAPAAAAAVSSAAFAMTPTRLDALTAAAGVPLTYKRAMSGNAQVVTLPYAMNQQDASVIAARLRTLANVQYAEPDRWLFPAAAPTPNDPKYPLQWHLTDPTVSGVAGAADLPGAWNITTGSSSVVVGVIDTGVLNHADLAANLVGGTAASSGYDMISYSSPAYSGTAGSNDGDGRDSDPTDPGDWEVAGTCGNGLPATQTLSSWHGTHVSGIIGAIGNNGTGVAGINWHTSILMVRALGVCGGMMSDIEDALTWAAGGSVPGAPTNAHPAKVINMSIGGSGSCDSSMQTAIDYAVNKGIPVVVAAGNNAKNVANYTPASCQHVITVAAVGPDGERSYYSNYDTSANHIIALSAPGGDDVSAALGGFPYDEILSTFDTGTTTANNDNAYAFDEGTSMATPVVTGTIALMLAANPALTNGTIPYAEIPGIIKQRLQQTARPFPSGTPELTDCTTTTCGAGIVDAAVAVTSVSTPPVADAGPDQTIFTLSGTDTLDGSGSNAPYGTITSYAWTQTAGTTVTLTGANTATPSFIAPTTPQTLTFQLTVTNDVGLSSTASVNVNVLVGPVITGLNPPNVVVLGSGFALTVTGINFSATSVVQWNGTTVPTTYVSATELKAPIPSDDLLEPRVIPVTVADGALVSKAASFDVIIPATGSGGGGGAANPTALLALAVLALLLPQSSGRKRS